MPENAEILISLARHEERIDRNREDVEENRESIGENRDAISATRAECERRDARIDMLVWFALLIAGGLATLAFAVLKQGMIR